MKDEAIEEIWLVRRKIQQRFGSDLKAYLDHYKELDKKYKDRLLKSSEEPASVKVRGVPPQTT